MSIIEPPVAARDVDHWDITADVIVAGLGVAGVSAALEAFRAGADVLVLERASGGGGASATSEGIFYLGGGTKLQKDLGYDETVDNMFAFMRASTTTPDEDKLRLFCESSPAHFDWLEAHGVPFERKAFTGKAVAVRTGEGLLSTGNEKAWPFREAATPVPRGHQTRGSAEEKGGAPAMRNLIATFEREGVPAMYDTRVTGLVTDGDGGVCGVRAKHEGKEIFVAARKGVILTTGSFNLNKELTSANLPIVAKYGSPLGIDTNDGAGLLMGESVGASTQGMDGVIATCSIYPPAQLIKGIIVNKLGQRFVAEDVYHGRLAYFVERQPESKAYLIVDEEIFERPLRPMIKFVDGWETIEETEQGLGLPEGSLVETLRKYNEDIATTGEDNEFHKYHDWLKVLDKGPYAAFDLSFETTDYHYISLGGLSTDANGQVVDGSQHPIRGLYAAGAVAAHFPQNGGEYASGMSLGPGSFFGRRAGRHASTGDATLA
jgi:succinate dehydrogenase/fumarate reductase flavoprotein subunit